MMPGVVASGLKIAAPATLPGWLPATFGPWGGISFLDFTQDTAYAGGADTTLVACLGPTYDPASRDSTGTWVDSHSSDNEPIPQGDFLADLLLVAGGLTIVMEVNFGVDGYLPAMVWSDTPDLDGFDQQVYLYTDINSTEAEDWWDADAFLLHSSLPTGIHRIGWTLWYDAGGGSYKYAVSVDGSDPTEDTISYDGDDHGTLIYARMFKMTEWFDYAFDVKIRTTEVYPAVIGGDMRYRTAMPLTISPTLAGPLSRNLLYSFATTSTGGIGTKVYSIQSGSLPTGLSISSSTGTISGRPSSAGTFNDIVVRVTDSFDATFIDASPIDITVDAVSATGNIAAYVVTSCPGSTVDHDITADLGGLTPEGALFFWVGEASGGSSANALMGKGACDASAQWAIACGQTNSSSTKGRKQVSDACVLIVDASGTQSGKAGFVTFITDGVRINWSDAAPNGWKLGVILFAGPDLTVKCGTVATPSTSGTTVTTGFEPELVFVGSAASTFGAATDTRFSSSFGWAIWDGATVQEYSQFFGTSATINTAMWLYPGGVAGMNDSGSGSTPTYVINLDTFTGTSFDMTASAAAGSADDFGYLAISYDGNANYFTDKTFYSPTGIRHETGVGFAPALVIGHQFPSSETPSTSQINKSGGGFIVWDRTVADTFGITAGSAGSAARSYYDHNKFTRRNSSGTIEIEADYIGMEPDGWSVNATTIEVFWDLRYLAIGF